MLQPVARRERIGALDCVVVDPVRDEFVPKNLVVLCHGFGASGTDLVDCSMALWQLELEALSTTRFIFPAGPISLDPTEMFDSRAWWMIDIDRLNQMIATGEFRDLRNECPDLLNQRRREVTELVEQVVQQSGVNYGQVFLGGFSQGAMMTTDVALHLPQPIGGLIVWSGTLLNEAVWKTAADRESKFPVFVSHGRQDPILPFTAAQWLHEFLVLRGFAAEFCPFDGVHEIPMPAMRGAAKLLAQQIKLAENG